MPPKNILDLLAGGDRRSLGRANQIATTVSRHPELFSQLIAGLWSTDPVVRMRAADATEKVTRPRPDLLQPYKRELLGLMSECQQQELRWHLAVIIPRLTMSGKERQAAISALTGYLEDRSSIVKTFALQGLADLVQDDPSIRAQVRETLRAATRTGTPAMKARSRKLLLHLEKA